MSAGSARLRTGGDRAGGVADPLAPRTRVEHRVDAQLGESEHLVGRSHPGPAVDADGPGAISSTVRHPLPVLGEVLAEGAVLVEPGRGGAVDRPRDVAGDGV